MPLPLRPPKAPATQAVPKQTHWLHGPMPKPPEGKAMPKPPEGNVTAKGRSPIPLNLVDAFLPHARAKKVRRKKNKNKTNKKKHKQKTKRSQGHMMEEFQT